MREKKCLKIAMLGHKRVPSREGGVEIVVEELSTRMVTLGHEVTCYNRKGHHVSGKEFDSSNNSRIYKGVRLKPVFTIDKKGLAAMSASFIACIKIAFTKYDVVHFHAEGSCAMIWIPKLFGKRCVVTIHGLDWARSKWSGFAVKYIKFGKKMAVKYADEIIVLSNNVQQYFRDTYNRKTIFIPNGIIRPEKVQAREIFERYGLKQDSYFLFLGRIVPEKGVHYLINAFRGVKTGKKLIIAGGASDTDQYMNELKTLAQGDTRIIFTHFVQGRLLEELYSSAYTYVLPSDLEGMPLSLLEAMGYGNCCIVSDIAECTEVVEENAVIFDKGDEADLGAKLQMLCDQPEMVSEYKKRSSDFICNKYNWDKIVSQTVKLYTSKGE